MNNRLSDNVIKCAIRGGGARGQSWKQTADNNSSNREKFEAKCLWKLRLTARFDENGEKSLSGLCDFPDWKFSEKKSLKICKKIKNMFEATGAFF